MKTVSTDSAPAAVGPYSQATVSGSLLFTSGQIPLDPATGRLASGGFREQVRQALANLDAVLEAAGTNRSRVLKVTVFLTDLERFGELNEVYAEYFGTARPARSAVQVARLPLDAQVEIEAVAEVP